MCKALVHIFNLSLKNGEFISKFKVGKVIPIYKKGSKKLLENYRPTCMLTSIDFKVIRTNNLQPSECFFNQT